MDKLADRGFACSILAAESMFGPAWREDRRWQLLYNGVEFEPFAQPPDTESAKAAWHPRGRLCGGARGHASTSKKTMSSW